MYVIGMDSNPLFQLLTSSGELLKKMWSFPIRLMILRPVYSATVSTLHTSIRAHKYASSRILDLCKASRLLLDSACRETLDILSPRGSGIFHSDCDSIEGKKSGLKARALNRKLVSIAKSVSFFMLGCIATLLSHTLLLLAQILIIPTTVLTTFCALLAYIAFFLICNVVRNVHFAVGNTCVQLKKASHALHDDVFESLHTKRATGNDVTWGFNGRPSEAHWWCFWTEKIKDSLSVKKYLKSTLRVNLFAYVVSCFLAYTMIVTVGIPLLAIIAATAALIPIVQLIIFLPCMAFGHLIVGEETLQKWSNEICGDWGFGGFKVNPSSPFSDSPNRKNSPSYTEMDKMFPDSRPNCYMDMSEISYVSLSKKQV